MTDITESMDSLALTDKAFSGPHYEDLARIALNTGVFRDGLLLGVDARVGAALHPTVRIMGYKKNAGGGRLCGLYGKPGDGKSELLKTCSSLAPYPRKGSVGKIDTPFASAWWEHDETEMGTDDDQIVERQGLGTTEGMIKRFLRKAPAESLGEFVGHEDTFQAPPVPTLQGATRALFVLSEANKMLKRLAKPGDDSLETILQLCTADGVGTNNAGEDTDRDLNGDWYNCTILLGGQAHVVGEVAKDDSSGLRERSEWALAADPDVPDRGDTVTILEELLDLDTDDMVFMPEDDLPGMDPDDVARWTNLVRDAALLRHVLVVPHQKMRMFIQKLRTTRSANTVEAHLPRWILIRVLSGAITRTLWEGNSIASGTEEEPTLVEATLEDFLSVWERWQGHLRVMEHAQVAYQIRKDRERDLRASDKGMEKMATDQVTDRMASLTPSLRTAIEMMLRKLEREGGRCAERDLMRVLPSRLTTAFRLEKNNSKLNVGSSALQGLRQWNMVRPVAGVRAKTWELV